MNLDRRTGIATLVALSGLAFCGLWTVFFGSIAWAQTGSTLKLVVGIVMTVFALIPFGVFLSFLIWPRYPRRATPMGHDWDGERFDGRNGNGYQPLPRRTVEDVARDSGIVAYDDLQPRDYPVNPPKEK